jgi:hypothetical protein
VPVFIATPTSAWATAGASLVPSPVIATSLAFGLLAFDQGHFVFGRRFGRKSSTPASRAIVAAGQRFIAVIMTVLMPIARNWSKRSFIPPLTMSFR